MSANLDGLEVLWYLQKFYPHNGLNILVKCNKNMRTVSN